MHDPNFPSNLAIQPSHPNLDDHDSRSGASLRFDQKSGIETYGIAGRVWEAAYTLATYTTSPTSTASLPGGSDADVNIALEFDPPCSLFRAGTNRTITIVEIGSGTGYAGVHVAQQLDSFYRRAGTPASATVILTDLANVVPLLDKGLKEHADSVGDVEVQAQALAWGDAGHADALARTLQESGKLITHVLCSDLVYFPHLYPPLLRTLLTLTAPPFCDPSSSPEVIIGYKVRSLAKESPFWQVFGTWFKFEVVLARQKGGKGDWARFGHANDVFIFVATRRPESFKWDIPAFDTQLMNGYGPTPPALDDTFETLLMLGMDEGV